MGDGERITNWLMWNFWTVWRCWNQEGKQVLQYCTFTIIETWIWLTCCLFAGCEVTIAKLFSCKLWSDEAALCPDRYRFSPVCVFLFFPALESSQSTSEVLLGFSSILKTMGFTDHFSGFFCYCWCLLLLLCFGLRHWLVSSHASGAITHLALNSSLSHRQ